MPVKKSHRRAAAGPRRRYAERPPITKRINLALQGGGAHGAFTWGVLEHLLSDDRLEIEGISGTSAGAMNAIMLADGLARGGRAGSAKAAGRFLARGQQHRRSAALQRAVVERLLSFTPLEGTPVQAWFDVMSRYFSPYDFNPLNINPLKDLVERFVDFKAVRASPTCSSSFRRPTCRPAGCGSFRARRSPPMR